MATQARMATRPTSDAVVEQKLQKLRELYADAPEVGKVALQHGMADIAREFAALTGATGVQSAGRVGSRQGKVSELTAILQIAKGGAKRLRGLLELVEGNFRGADVVGTLHDMRFVFLENDTKLLFATAYDGEWDAYIDDFVTKIPDHLDVINSAMEGWPGIRSPGAKDYIANHQITAEGWYVGNDLTVAETKRLQRLGAAVDEFLDKVGDE
jgi:hypothetical protein